MGAPAIESPASSATVDAPTTLAQPAQKRLGLLDSLGLWGNLGISLLLPVAAAYVVLPGDPFGPTLIAIITGSVIGSVLLGLGAAAGAREGVPAMVLLRGLLGRRLSYLPTALNVVQCVGWATFEIVIIAQAASTVLGAPKWPFVLGAGAVATLMALRPLGSVRVLARYAVWVALAGVVYVFVRVLLQPLPDFADGGGNTFWTAVDVVISLPVSWFPLAADYTRHVRSGRSAFAGSSIGYGVATIVFFMLGALSLAAYGAAGLDVIDALLAVPLGAMALLLLVFVEVDEAFANIYSTALSAQNVTPKVDRRVLALIVGVIATTLAFTFDIVGYEAFLLLIGSVFVPLVGVFAVAYYVMPRGAWDTSAGARARPLLLLPWVAGFAAFQIVSPTYFDGPGAGWTTWWSARQADLGVTPGAFSGSLSALGVAALLTVVVCLPALLRGRRTAARNATEAATKEVAA
jgi:NCS1 family nucleobase:cation symporter-1